MNKKFLILLSMLLNFLTFGEVKKNYDCNFFTTISSSSLTSCNF